MPKLYDCFLLARSMRENIPVPDYIDFYIDNRSDSSLFSLGYFGKIYLDHSHQEILFVHRSTTINGQTQPHENSSIVATSNILSDTSIYFQRLPQESLLALRFVEKHYRELIKNYPTYSCVHIGHSLGGFHAHYCGYSFRQRVVAIDSPGAREVIKQQFSVLDAAQCQTHITICLQRNLINETNQHVGRLAFRSYDERWSGIPSISESSDTLRTHSLKLFMEHIPEDAADPNDELPSGFFWCQPKVSMKHSVLYANSSKHESSISSSEYESILSSKSTTNNSDSKCFIL